jgi:hypothetical protein
MMNTSPRSVFAIPGQIPESVLTVIASHLIQFKIIYVLFELDLPIASRMADAHGNAPFQLTVGASVPRHILLF